MMSLYWAFHLLVIFSLAPVIYSTSPCLFPSYMQRRQHGQTRTWRQERARGDGAPALQLVVTFEGDTMKVIPVPDTESPSPSGAGQQALERDAKLPRGDDDDDARYVRTCVEETAEGRYLVVHRRVGQGVDYHMCVEFVRRSPAVVQLRTSQLTRARTPRLCDDDELTLDDWPLLYRELLALAPALTLTSTFEEGRGCSLHGGYDVRLYDPVAQEAVCHSYEGETRVEAECTSGDGIYFRFRFSHCVPLGLRMRVDQRTFCLASWQDDVYAYSVLRHDVNTDTVWCLRHPVDSSEQFTAHLFYDMVCDSSAQLTATQNFVRMDVTRSVARQADVLCADDYEACAYVFKDTCPSSDVSNVMRMTCARRCKICSDVRPSFQTVPPKYRGVWSDSVSLLVERSREFMEISEMFIQVGGANGAKFRVISWNTPDYLKQSLGQDTESISSGVASFSEVELMLVATFDNGCRHRYLCAQLRKSSPSVLRAKFSLAQVWPFEGTTPAQIDCSSFKYATDQALVSTQHQNSAEGSSGSGNHTKHNQNQQQQHQSLSSSVFKMYVSGERRQYVDCSLIGPRYVIAHFPDGATCSGTLMLQGRTKMKLILENCADHQTEREFACLDNPGGVAGGKVKAGGGGVSRGSRDRVKVTVTEMLDVEHRFVCWIEPVYPRFTLYLVPMSHCHEAVVGDIVDERHTPLITFRELRPTPPPMAADEASGSGWEMYADNDSNWTAKWYESSIKRWHGHDDYGEPTVEMADAASGRAMTSLPVTFFYVVIAPLAALILLFNLP